MNGDEFEGSSRWCSIFRVKFLSKFSRSVSINLRTILYLFFFWLTFLEKYIFFKCKVEKLRVIWQLTRKQDIRKIESHCLAESSKPYHKRYAFSFLYISLSSKRIIIKSTTRYSWFLREYQRQRTRSINFSNATKHFSIKVALVDNFYIFPIFPDCFATPIAVSSIVKIRGNACFLPGSLVSIHPVRTKSG